MATYLIGDLQGCYDVLQSLLDEINFDPAQDRLGFVGDLVNRGPDSLKTLRFVRSLKDPLVVLGNHDFALMALSVDAVPKDKKHNLQPIIDAEDSADIINWLRTLPLLIAEEQTEHCPAFIMVHAGIVPAWNLQQAISLNNEVMQVLQSDKFSEFMHNLFGPEPRTWSEQLTGWDRIRYITNAFTRLRFCTADSTLEFAHKYKQRPSDAAYRPWFELLQKDITAQHILCFGHWAALGGEVSTDKVFGLDTGAVWGGAMTALRVEDQSVFSVPA